MVAQGAVLEYGQFEFAEERCSRQLKGEHESTVDAGTMAGTTRVTRKSGDG